ncbi:MAG TPA: IPT/TIG domain-containing protein [Polyangiaceae bacterium]
MGRSSAALATVGQICGVTNTIGCVTGISTTLGYPGDTITLSGYFDSGAYQTAVTVGTAQASVLCTSPIGPVQHGPSYSCSFPLPPNPLGTTQGVSVSVDGSPIPIQIPNGSGGFQTTPFAIHYGTAAITSLSPTSGSPLGGNPVTLYGKGLGLGEVVDFGSSATATIDTCVDSTQCTVIAPPVAGGTVYVQIPAYTIGGVDQGVGTNYTYQSAPDVTLLFVANAEVLWSGESHALDVQLSGPLPPGVDTIQLTSTNAGLPDVMPVHFAAGSFVAPVPFTVPSTIPAGAYTTFSAHYNGPGVTMALPVFSGDMGLVVSPSTLDSNGMGRATVYLRNATTHISDVKFASSTPFLTVGSWEPIEAGVADFSTVDVFAGSPSGTTQGTLTATFGGNTASAPFTVLPPQNQGGGGGGRGGGGGCDKCGKVCC